MDRKSISNSLLLILMVIWVVIIPQVEANGVDHKIFSKVLNESRTISVILPESYNQNLGVRYPVLYVLDGVQQLPHTAGTAKSLYTYGEMPDLIIVGIDSTNRTRDMTPTMLPGVENSGKADIFLKFLNSELKPYINNQYRTNNYNMLAGHSFGGLLVTYSLIVDPSSFQARFAFSPSLRFLGQKLFDQLGTTVKNNTDSKLYFYMNVGAEQDRVLAAFGTVSKILEQASSNLIWHAVELTQETHFTTPIIGQFQGFRELFNNWKLTLAISRQGVSAIEAFYKSLSSRVGYNVKAEEAQVNNAAYELLNVTGDADLAKKIFELNKNNYPESPNAYIGLARISQMKGNIESTAQLLEKAIALVDKDDVRYHRLKERLSGIQQR